MTKNVLYYGDNLDVLRKKIKDETIDLCYIDPPFNSKRNYNQIYNNIGSEDLAQAQAFIDTWVWDERANAGYLEIIANDAGRFTPQTVELIKGLHAVLGYGSLLAYVVSMTLRITEIWRVLKPTGSFYLHCDPTASHYLKILLDSIFLPNDGAFQNELIWHYSIGGKSKRRFARKHDVIFWYTKNARVWTFNGDAVRIPYEANRKTLGGVKRIDENGRPYRETWGTGSKKVYRYYLDEGKIPEDVWELESINSNSPERLGYPTQKPDPLLQRIIQASSNEGDLILDAFCGCGTTVAMAQELHRQWIGIDITYQSIAVVLKRLEDQFGSEVLKEIALDGIPRDMASAHALAHKKDDRVRKEFEKWAVLTYTNNRARINEKKGADGGIDGVAYTMTGSSSNAKIILQVKSGHVSRGDVATLRGDMQRENAPLAVLITLDPPTAPMIAEAKAIPPYHHPLMGRNYDALQIVTVQDIIERGKRLDIPMSLDVLKSAQRKFPSTQLQLLDVAADHDYANNEEDTEDEAEEDPDDLIEVTLDDEEE